MQANPTRYARISTDHPGLSYRLRSDGSRTYYGLVDERRVKLKATSHRAAVAEYGELRGKVAKGAKLPPASVRFKDVAESWYAQSEERLRPWTRKQYRQVLDVEVLPRLGRRRLADIGLEDVLSLIRALERRKLSRSTISNYLLCVSGPFKHATRLGLVSSNPCSLVDKRVDITRAANPRKAHEWTDKEIADLLGAAELIAKQSESRYDYSPILRVAVGTGLRLGELLGLQWGDVETDKGVLHVRRQLTRLGDLAEPKTPKALRRVPLSLDLAAFLRRQRMAAALSTDEDFVFQSRTGGPLSHRNVQRRAFEAARDLSDLPKTLTFHDLRHAHASLAAHRGVPVAVLSEVLGHTDVGVTQRIYTHLYNREAAEENYRQLMDGAL